MMKRAFWITTLGIAFGSLGATWAGPKFIGWWYQSPVTPGIDCRPAIDWAMQKLIIFQLIGLALGLTLGLTISFFARPKKPSFS